MPLRSPLLLLQRRARRQLQSLTMMPLLPAGCRPLLLLAELLRQPCRLWALPARWLLAMQAEAGALEAGAAEEAAGEVEEEAATPSWLRVGPRGGARET